MIHVGPDGVEHEFPDDAPPEAVRAAMQKHYAQKKPVAGRSWAMEALPIGGAVVGGVGAGPVGAALGAGIGEEAAQLTEMLRGKREQADVPGILRTGAEQGAMEAVGGPIIRGVGRALKAGASKLVEAALPRSATEARLVQGYHAAEPLWRRFVNTITDIGKPGPRTVAQTITERGLAGTESGLGTQAKRASVKLWNRELLPALRQSTEKVNIPQFFDDVEKQIVAKNPELARQQDLIEALNSLRESYKGVGDVSMEELQKFKHGWAKFVPEKAYRGKPIAGAFNDVQNMTADMARKKIYEALGDESKQAYLDYGNLQEVMKHGQRAMTGGRLRGGFGGFWSAIKDMAVTPVSTIGSQVVYRTGQGIELVGAPGARVVRDIVAGIPEVGRPLHSPHSEPPPQAQSLPTPAPTPQPTPQQLEAVKPQQRDDQVDAVGR